MHPGVARPVAFEGRRGLVVADDGRRGGLVDVGRAVGRDVDDADVGAGLDGRVERWVGGGEWVAAVAREVRVRDVLDRVGVPAALDRGRLLVVVEEGVVAAREVGEWLEGLGWMRWRRTYPA